MQMRRLYLHAGNKFTFNPIQAGGGFWSFPFSPPPPLLFLKISTEHFKVTVTYTSTSKSTSQPNLTVMFVKICFFLLQEDLIWFLLIQFQHTLISAIFHVVQYNCWTDPCFLVIDLREKHEFQMTKLHMLGSVLHSDDFSRNFINCGRSCFISILLYRDHYFLNDCLGF